MRADFLISSFKHALCLQTCVVSVFISESNFCSQRCCLDVLAAPSGAGEAGKEGRDVGVLVKYPTRLFCRLKPL